MAHFEPCNLFGYGCGAAHGLVVVVVVLMGRLEALGKSCSIGYRKQ